MAYRLAPGLDNMMIPGFGIASYDTVIEGDFANLVAVGILVEIPLVKGKTKVAEALVEPAPPAAASDTAVSLVDSSGGTAAAVEDELPPARKPETRKRR